MICSDTKCWVTGGQRFLVTWFDTHTVHLDLSLLYFPLIADMLAMVVNVTREADFLEKNKEEKV